MLKKWWVWVLVILFIAINLLIKEDEPIEKESNVDPINSEISTH